MAENAQKEVFIDVDIVIASYNKKNPKKRQLNRTELAKILGVKTQVFSDWKSKKKKTPKWANILLTLLDLGKIPTKEFIYEKDV